MEKIAIYNRKGGVGKSTTCLNIAGCLDTKYRKRVLVVDCDPQANITTCLTLNSNDVETYHDIAELFSEKKEETEKYIYPVVLPDRSNRSLVETHICLLKGSKELDRVNTTNMYVLRDFLNMYDDKFDYCLIDCPPSLTDVTINVLCAADYLMIPCLSGRDGVNGYGMVVEEVNNMKDNGYNPNIRILGVFVNAIDKRYALDNYYATLWSDDFKANSFQSQVRRSSDVPNAYEFGKPVQYYKNSKVCKDYEDLTKEMISKIKYFKKGVR